MRNRLLYLIGSILVLLTIYCGQKKNPDFWPENGTAFRNVTWEVDIADSTSILKIENGYWVLPVIHDSLETQIKISYHQSSSGKSQRQLKERPDQEVFHPTGTVKKEYYKFSATGVQLLGYENTDSTRFLTMYEPALFVLPSMLSEGDTMFSESKPEIMNLKENTTLPDQITRVKARLIKLGKVSMDSTFIPAKFFEVTMSQDRKIGFGEQQLVVPDAVSMASYILFMENYGPVLEWGVRARRADSEINGTFSDPQNPGDTPELNAWKQYIEITYHEKIKIEN